MHSPQSEVAQVDECTVASTSLEVARCASPAGAVSACHPFVIRDRMFSYFGEKVRGKPRKLLLASIRPP